MQELSDCIIDVSYLSCIELKTLTTIISVSVFNDGDPLPPGQRATRQSVSSSAH